MPRRIHSTQHTLKEKLFLSCVAIFFVVSLSSRRCDAVDFSCRCHHSNYIFERSTCIRTGLYRKEKRKKWNCTRYSRSRKLFTVFFFSSSCVLSCGDTVHSNSYSSTCSLTLNTYRSICIVARCIRSKYCIFDGFLHYGFLWYFFWLLLIVAFVVVIAVLVDLLFLFFIYFYFFLQLDFWFIYLFSFSTHIFFSLSLCTLDTFMRHVIFP